MEIPSGSVLEFVSENGVPHDKMAGVRVLMVTLKVISSSDPTKIGTTIEATVTSLIRNSETYID